MKANFKPMGLAVAVATAATGYVGAANAVERAIGNLGDTAIIPYYTVQDDWVTGVHIINSGPQTTVVKLRLRRAEDSADALDINLIMSPYDEWVGSIDDSSGNIVLTAGANQDGVRDTTCTAPLRADGRFPMQDLFREGAEEGYIEVIGMGSPVSESYPIAVAAKHSDGTPLDCTSVASNFFQNTRSLGGPLVTNTPANVGNISNYLTHQGVTGAELVGFSSLTTCIGTSVAGGVCQNWYEAASPSLKVSYFMRDAGTGIEFGGDAIHLVDFNQGEAWMTNQQFGLFSGDPFGFDYPDLAGGPWYIGTDPFNPTLDLPTDPSQVGSGAYFLRVGIYNQLRDGSVLGVSQVLNDWSVAAERGVSTDWVVTFPGQYAMLDYFVWLSQGLDDANCGRPALVTGQTAVPLCNFRDIPVTADLTLYDREEGVIEPDEGELVISPAPPVQRNVLTLPNEVNVIEWSDGSNTPVLGSEFATTVDPTVLGESGWASLSVASATRSSVETFTGEASDGLAVCQFVPVESFDTNGIRSTVCLEPAEGNVPVVGFVAWERSFPSNPDGNYGRLIDHSFVQGSSRR